jgi:hypothetical protein
MCLVVLENVARQGGWIRESDRLKKGAGPEARGGERGVDRLGDGRGDAGGLCGRVEDVFAILLPNWALGRLYRDGCVGRGGEHL